VSYPSLAASKKPGHKNVHFLSEQSDRCRVEPSVEYRKIIEAKGEFKKVPLDPEFWTKLYA
jgi:hypothetical protein